MLGNYGFACAGGRRDNYRMALVYIVNCFLLETVVEHIDIISKIIDLSNKKE